MTTTNNQPMSKNEIKERIKKITSQLSYLKEIHANGDDNPWGWGTVLDAKKELRARKKALQEQLKAM